MPLDLTLEKNFEDEIKKNLEGLDHKQTVFFVWLCAARALPFLGAKGNFNFWHKEEREKHLYYVLNALDIAQHIILGDYKVYDNSADDAATAAFEAAEAIDKLAEAKEAVNAAAEAACTADEAANAIHTYANEVIHDSIVDMILKVCKTDIAIKINLYDIIISDIECIKAGAKDKFNNDISLYGEIWDNFQTALKECGCAYWGKLYEKIFQSKFKIDKEALELRINIPEEIKELGAKTVADYLEELEKGSKNLNEARIIILGEKGAGKTCLARRLINPNAKMTKPNESTEGVVTETLKIGSKDNLTAVNTHIWDFAGHVITHTVHRCFLSERCTYIIVYNGRTEQCNRLDYWLDYVRNYGGDAPTWILINKFDVHKPDISKNKLKKKYPFIKDFVYFSIGEDKNSLNNFRKTIEEFILNNPSWNNQNLPSSYFEIKNALENHFQQSNEDHISKKKFYDMAHSTGIDKQKYDSLLSSLSELGICLWYKDIEEFDMLVLNPNWISNGVYKVINWAHNNKKPKPVVKVKNYEDIFKEEKDRYPEYQFRYILKLMIKYELAYPNEKDDNVITIPHLLNEDQPSELPIFDIDNSLMIKYASSSPLPPHTVCRLIVKHHEKISSEEEVWRYGVVLKFGKNTIALVYEDDRDIIIKVKGSEKSKYITELKGTMDYIFESYKSDKPELRYKVIFSNKIEFNAIESKANSEGIMLPTETITSHIEKGRKYFEPKTKQLISLEDTAEIYNITVTGDNNILTIGTDNKININIDIDYSSLNEEIEKIRNHLRSKEQNDENDILIGEFTQLKKAVEEKDDNKILSIIKEIGAEVYDIAKNIACPVITSYFSKGS